MKSSALSKRPVGVRFANRLFHRCTSALFLCALFLLFGCTKSVYHVELHPDGDGLKRVVSLSEQAADSPEKPPKNQEEIDRIASLYATNAPSEDGDKRIFTGRFVGQMPADIGGSGSYTRFISALGSTYVYQERFRGNDSLVATIADRQRAVDQLMDLFVGWIGEEVEDAAMRDRLQQWLRTDVREDMSNLSLYLWLQPPDGKEESQEFITRLTQYFVERNYFSLTDIPRIVRFVEQKNESEMVRFVQRLVLRKIGLEPSTPLPPSLAKLSAIQTSLRNYIQKTEQYRQLIDVVNEDSPEADPLDVIDHLIIEMALPGIFEQISVVEVSLHLEAEPSRTNGQWQAETRVVEWSHAMGQSAMPTFCFATWSQADVKTQETHFGSVVLTGESLEKYVMWYNSLTSDEASEWDGILAALTPESAQESLEAFTFSRDSLLAETAREILLGSLTSPER